MENKVVCYTGHGVAENDTRTRIVTIYGKRTTNHVIFFARMLYKIGKCVLVIDNSGENELMEYIAVRPEDDGRIQYQGITYLTKRAYEKRVFEQFDVVLVICGLRWDPVMEEKSNQVYLYTDFQKHSSDKVMELARSIQIPYAMVYTDCVKCNFAQPNYIEFGFHEAAGKIMKRYFLPLSAQDYACSLMLQYSSRFKVRDFSPEYQEMLYMMVHSLFPEYTLTRLKSQCAV